ncbi:hypothetical protein [Dyadobacter sp. 3J3]|uniref:hypothetical protein n=1 Tax=Dyadobacter sp. 3J3 TaxID=2606600 RepID=UPI0013578287|nr:hypothetical protein [Dyadobacter sp. 3J3]
MKGFAEIIIQQQLDLQWEDRFEGMTICYRDNHTILQGTLKDQAHLHGILNVIRDLNLKLISVNLREPG